MAKREYIEREAARLAYEKSLANDNHRIEGASAIHRREHRYILHILEKLSAADVVEVRHGEWDIKSRSYRMIDDYDEEIYVECPFCKRTFYVPYEFDDEKTIAYARENYPYCHCGAKMDGERKDKP